MNKIFEQLLEQRRIGEDFLKPLYQECGSDEDLPDIGKAARRIREAMKNGDKVMIYGDYDADGVTASVVMHDALKLAGIKEVAMMLPDRFVDGYGMSQRCVERAKELGVNLVITVDCGSNNADVVAELLKEGIETVVTDHHEVLGKLPKAVAVVNPKRRDIDSSEELRDLAGVGVAFMLARKLVAEGLIASGQEKWMLDLVLIGTICDSMALIGLNRELCYYGMKVLERTRRPGLQELMQVAGVKKITSDAIGFQLGPRINAAGRVASAERALNLLMTQSRVEAVKLADELEELNNQRKNQQNMAVREVERRGVGEESVIVVAGKWHEGVLGIIAGRLTEQYRRPAFVLTEVEKGVLKGSGRSFGDFNLAEALAACSNEIVAGGGHAGACGLKVLVDRLEDFKKAVNQYYKSLNLVDQERFLRCEADLEVERLADLNLELMSNLEMLEPYGPGNREPVFLLAGMRVTDVRRMGAEGQHLKLEVEDKTGMGLKVVGFGVPETWRDVRVGDEVNVWVALVVNEWNGLQTVEGRIVRLEGVK